MNNKESIEATRRGFEASFQEGALYNRQTQDEEHLNRILNALELTNGMTVLDLGTGSGYVAMELARRYPKVKVTGLDIVEETLRANAQRAEKEGLRNLSFVSYGGEQFPFEDQTFDVIVARYCLHHFPDIDGALLQISRVLKHGGLFFIADPTPNEEDVDRFVDDYMRMKPDGHIKYYTSEELSKIGRTAGLELAQAFETQITFPRFRETAYGFDEIRKKHKREVVEGYQVKESEDGKYIYITQRVMNLAFRKEKTTYN